MNSIRLALLALLLAGCADYTVPLSSDNPPPPGSKVDQHCMQDCLGDNTDAALCHDRCAK